MADADLLLEAAGVLRALAPHLEPAPGGAFWRCVLCGKCSVQPYGLPDHVENCLILRLESAAKERADG